MTKRFLFGDQAVNSYYGAAVSVLELSSPALSSGEIYSSELRMSSAGFIAGIKCENLKKCRIKLYASSSYSEDSLQYEALCELANSHRFDFLKLYQFVDGIAYLRIENLEENSEEITIKVEFVRFFEVETLRNFGHSGTIQVAENKTYDIFVADSRCKLESVYAKTKLGALTVGIYSDETLKYQFSVSSTNPINREILSHITFERNSLVTLRVSSASFAEDFFFNLVFNKL